MRKRARLQLLTLLLVGVMVSFAWGHGKETHTEAERSGGHMAAMQQLKEQIPPEYRVMNRTPVVPDQASLDNGAAVYQQQCAVCHGPDGKGKGPAAGTMDPPPSSFLDLEHSAIYGPGEKFWIVSHGSGPTGMPGFGEALTPKQRWDVINHIYRLQERASE